MLTTTVRPYNTRSRNIFPVSMEGCVLYLPFWQEDMQGSTLLSYDHAHRSCAVTGATWGSTGRTFDGLTYYVDCTDIVALNLAATATFIFWYDPASTLQNKTLWGKKVDVDNMFDALQGNDGKFYFRIGIGVSGTDGTFTNTETVGTFIHMAVVYDGAGANNAAKLKMYKNGVAQTLAYTGTIQTTLYDMAGASFLVGKSTSAWAGTVGEFLVYSRALTGAEVLHNYQVTKWRY